MEEPTPRVSRLALALGVAASLVVGGAGFLVGRATSPRPAAVVPAATPTPSPGREAMLTGVLTRADLIALAADAADAMASGRTPERDTRTIDGRRFELRLPFGCGGPADAESDAPMHWRYDEGSQALRLHVQPVSWPVEEWWPSVEGDQLQTIEGFWIERPWTSSEECPPAGESAAEAEDASDAPPALPPTLAIAQLYTAEGSRRGRRNGKPYEAVVRVPADELDVSRGFRLRIAGRIEANSGSGPVSCRAPTSRNAPPVCLIGAAMDEIAIENPATGETLAQWTLAGGDVRSAAREESGS